MTRKFRKVQNFEEIHNVLSRCKHDSAACVIWQNRDGHRVIGNLVLTNVELVNGYVSGLLQELPPQFDFNQSFYVNLPIRQSAFKCDMLDRSTNRVVLSYPSEIVSDELRRSKRYSFSLSDEKYAIVSKDKILADGKGLKVQLANVSREGFSCELGLKHQQLFNRGETIYLHALGDFKIVPAIEGIISFKEMRDKRRSFGSEKSTAIGVGLKTVIAKDIFDQFIYVEREVQVNDEQLLHDKGFRDSIQLETRKLVQRMKSSSTMRDWMNSLQTKRQENLYLKQHIDLLCQVTCGLAKSLGWVSESSYEKLIYISMIHDIRFLEFPELAKIKDKKEFEMVKSSLSDAEIKAFLEAPQYASMLAREDKNSYPDVDKVLLQQKERGDGSGFPTGITGHKISPLASLFIVCHDFVDYVLENPEWTYKEFYRFVKDRHKGIHFYKVLAVFKTLAETTKNR